MLVDQKLMVSLGAKVLTADNKCNSGKFKLFRSLTFALKSLSCLH